MLKLGDMYIVVVVVVVIVVLVVVVVVIVVLVVVLVVVIVIPSHSFVSGQRLRALMVATLGEAIAGGGGNGNGHCIGYRDCNGGRGGRRGSAVAR